MAGDVCLFIYLENFQYEKKNPSYGWQCLFVHLENFKCEKN